MIYRNNNTLYIKTIDFGDKSHAPVELGDEIAKKEKKLAAFPHDGKFYILSVPKGSSQLHVKIIAGAKIEKDTMVDLSGEVFTADEKTTFYDALKGKSLSDKNVNLTYIDNSNPSGLEMAVEQNKVYARDEKLYITLDHSLEETILVTVDLNDFSHSVSQYPQVGSECNQFIISNSYLYGSYLFQIKGCGMWLDLQIVDRQSEQVIESYRIGKDDTVSINNSPIMQKGSMLANTGEERVINTKKLLRKLMNSDMGISARVLSNSFELTIGGIKQTSGGGGGGGMMTSGGYTVGPASMPVSVPATFHPVMNSYGSYSSTRSVYFKSLLDKESFAHQPDKAVEDSAFDKMNIFEGQNVDKLKYTTVFKKGERYYFGYYDSKQRLYVLTEFEEQMP